jgi:hypothetical protein
MKTSDKILFSFLGFAWVSIMITLLVSFRYSTLKGLSILDKVEVKEWPISGSYSVVSIQNSWALEIDHQSQELIRYSKYFTSDKRGEELEDPDPFAYEVRNDTLFVKGMKQKPNGSFSIQIGDIKSFVLDDVVEVRIKSLPTDSLIVRSNKGQFILQKDHGVVHLDFEGNNDSGLQAFGLESLKLSLDRSKADLQLYLGGISGQVINRSEVTLPSQAGEMNVTKDKSSKILVEDSY